MLEWQNLINKQSLLGYRNYSNYISYEITQIETSLYYFMYIKIFLCKIVSGFAEDTVLRYYVPQSPSNFEDIEC